jgi:hypothetical protein
LPTNYSDEYYQKNKDRIDKRTAKYRSEYYKSNKANAIKRQLMVEHQTDKPELTIKRVI